jgi:geranylgeranyl pyrophosphate synthase
MTVHNATSAAANGSGKVLTEDFAAVVEYGMQSVEQKMHDIVDSSVDVLRDASRHILSSGGKRIRPRLLVLSYLAAGGTAPERVAAPAAAVELVHTASVVHDDINDHGVLRRGKPSVNAVWGRTFALLTGDFLFAKVYELMAPYRDMNVELAEATIALVEGETLQAAAVKENKLNREIYTRIIGLKTAALFRSAARIGARMAGGGAPLVDALGNYAFNVGLAFQVVDDILDLTADSEQLGKTAGIDLEQGRGIGAAYINEGKVQPSASEVVDNVKRKLLDGGAIEAGWEQANLLVASAISSLDVLPASPARDALVNLAHLVVERKF